MSAGGLPALLLDTLVKGSLLIALAAGLVRLLRHQSAAVRHAIWTVALLAQVAVPVLSVALPAWRLPLLPAVGSSSAAAEPSLASAARALAAYSAEPTVSVPSATAPNDSAPLSPWTILGALWLVGGVIVLGRFVWGTVAVAQLPRDSDSWSMERRLAVLTHEIAHVKRLDALTQLGGQAVLAVFWMNPLVWVATHQMRLERERACKESPLVRMSWKREHVTEDDYPGCHYNLYVDGAVAATVVLRDDPSQFQVTVRPAEQWLRLKLKKTALTVLRFFRGGCSAHVVA